MTTPLQKTPATVAAMRRLYDQCGNYAEVARQFGVAEVTAHKWIDDNYRKLINKRNCAYYRMGHAHVAEKGPPEADLAARLAEIPPDTRDLTGRMFGDPIPGRSALCKLETLTKGET